MLTLTEKTRLANEAWQDILQGDVSGGIPKLDVLISLGASIGEYNNRGIARLLLSQHDLAMADFMDARHVSPANHVELFVGVTHWLAGRKADAHNDWLSEFARQKSGSIIYAADAAGVILPAMILWSSVKLGDEASGRIALREILRRSKTARYKINWAGPIGEFLLNKTSEPELLSGLASGYDEVDMNRQCQSYFYIATANLREKKMDEYTRNLELCQSNRRILMHEYHLAASELASTI